MKPTPPRLRVFAGPNGSGKSTIKEVIPADWLGVYVNADEIESTVRRTGRLDLRDFQVATTTAALRAFLSEHPLMHRADLTADVGRITVREDEVHFDGVKVNSYHASATADFIRHRLLENRVSFTFETVMSSPDKVEFLRRAKESGFRVYLYFIATEDPQINVERVRFRAENGGHPVPEGKIRERYKRSLALLDEALSCTNRAYIFDNSGAAKIWLAEVTEGDRLEVRAGSLPAWFAAALPSFFE